MFQWLVLKNMRTQSLLLDKGTTLKGVMLISNGELKPLLQFHLLKSQTILTQLMSSSTQFQAVKNSLPTRTKLKPTQQSTHLLMREELMM
jgi:hypothetical protein